MSFFDISPILNYNDISSEFNTEKFKEMLKMTFVDNPYLYKVNRKTFYENIVKYKCEKTDSLFEFFESPSKQSFRQFKELVLNFQNLNDYVFSNLVSHFLLLSIYRFVRTKQDIFNHLDTLVLENKDFGQLNENLKLENDKLLQKLKNCNFDHNLQLNIKNSEISALNKKIVELEKKITKMNSDLKLEKIYNSSSTSSDFDNQKPKNIEGKNPLLPKVLDIDYDELTKKFDFNSNCRNEMPIYQNMWIDSITLAEKIKINEQKNKLKIKRKNILWTMLKLKN